MSKPNRTNAKQLSEIADLIADAGPAGVSSKPVMFELISFSNPTHYLGLTEAFEPVFRKRRDIFDEPKMLEFIGSSQLSLPAGVVENEAYRLPLGLTIITGRTAVGKSTFARALARTTNVRRVLAVEPADDPIELANTRTFSNADAAMMYLIAQSMAELKATGLITSLPMLDSLRAPVFETDGPAGDKGMIMAFFTQITRVSNTLAMNGLTMVATVNPMQTDPKYEEIFMQRLVSAVPCVIELTSISVDRVSESFTGKVTSRPLRRPVSFSWSCDIKPGPKRKLDSEEISFTISSDDELVPPLSAGQRVTLAASSAI